MLAGVLEGHVNTWSSNVDNSVGLDAEEPGSYAAARPAVFQSPSSFRWFERKHRDELVQRGALIKPAGRWLVRPTAFDKAICEIGARLASRGAK